MNKKYKIPISDEVKEILLAGRIEGACYFLPDSQLERSMYLNVNKVLEALGGKWNKKKRGHIFTSIPDIFDAVINDEIIDEKKLYQVFETPEVLGKLLIEMADITEDDEVLEPSIGSGAIAKMLPNAARIVGVEIQEKLCTELRDSFKIIECADFLTLTPVDLGKFDKVIMNPPFTSNQDIKHIRHAYDFLRGGGTLVAICGAHSFFASDKESIAFQEWFSSVHGQVTDNEKHAFKQSGTLVNTKIIWIEKQKRFKRGN